MDEDLLNEEEKKEKKKKTDQPTYEGKGEKFYFNLNHFENSYEYEEEEEEEDLPPPPTFSEEELESAKEASFHEGKSEGLQESAESREQFVAGLLEQISSSLTTLFDAELEREKRFEREAVHLSLKVFEQLFPHYNEEHGFEEMKRAMLDVLQKEEGLNQVQVELHPDYKEDIEAFLTSEALTLPRHCGVECIGVDGFAPAQFRLAWKDGGAIHDMDSLAGQIRDILTSALAGSAPSGHDDNEGDETAQEQPEPQEDTAPAPDETEAGADDKDDESKDEEHDSDPINSPPLPEDPISPDDERETE